MRIWKNHLEVSSVGKLIFAAAIILVGVALSTSALGAGRRVGGFSDGGGLAGGQFRGAFGADKFNDPRGGAPHGSGFAGLLDNRFDWFSRSHDGYDGNRYWKGDSCFPTEPGDCD